MSAPELERTCEELRRLLGLDRPVAPAAVVRLFSDAARVDDLHRPRATGELRALVDAEGRTAAPPPSPEVIASAVTAFWRWAQAGFGLVHPELLARRLAECERCEHYTDAPDDVLYALAGRAARQTRICAQCGCFVEKKARRATETCPAGRW